jgi:hypothetical protein
MIKLGTRARNCLRNFLGDDARPEVVAKLSDLDLYRAANVGKVTLEEIRDWLLAHDLDFRELRVIVPQKPTPINPMSGTAKRYARYLRNRGWTVKEPRTHKHNDTGNDRGQGVLVEPESKHV